jgi:hypothetical protein
MAIDYCTHLPTSYPDPQTLGQHYDNLTLLFCHVESLFNCINLAMEGREGGVADAASLGEVLCGEVRKRAEALYDFAARKEG